MLYFHEATNNPCISFGYLGEKIRGQLAEIAPVSSDPAGCRTQIYFGTPVYSQRGIYKKRCAEFIWYTVCENTVVNPRWIRLINESKTLWTPSQFSADVFRECGVTVPISVVHHGVDPDDWPYMKRPERDTFTFLWVGVNIGSYEKYQQGIGTGDRKCGYLVEQAFRELNLSDARLVLKGVPWPGPRMDVTLRGRIRYFYKWANREEMQQLFRETDAFIWPTRSEAFGTIPLEAAATGLPTIVTDYSGPHDYVDYRYFVPLRRYTMQESIYGKKYGVDAKNDLEEIKEKMLLLYEHQSEARRLGKAASEYVHREWTWDGRVRGQLKTALEKGGISYEAL